MAPVDCLVSRTWAAGTPRPEGSSTRPDNTAVSFCASKTDGRRIALRSSNARAGRFRWNSRFDIFSWTPNHRPMVSFWYVLVLKVLKENMNYSCMTFVRPKLVAQGIVLPRQSLKNYCASCEDYQRHDRTPGPLKSTRTPVSST